MDEQLQKLADHIAQGIPDAVAASHIRLGELTLETTPGKIVELLTFLRDDAGCLFKQVIDICGVDWPDRAKRFDVVYHLLSLKLKDRKKHTSELQSHSDLVCRLLLEKKKKSPSISEIHDKPL